MLELQVVEVLDLCLTMSMQLITPESEMCTEIRRWLFFSSHMSNSYELTIEEN